MTDQEISKIEGELKLISHRLEEIAKSQQDSFSKLEHRIGAIEKEGRQTAVWMGKTEQKIEQIEKSVDNTSTGSTMLAKAALALSGSLVGVISTLISTGKF